MYGVDPLRIFVFREGVANFASEQYQKPDKENLENSEIHFTNSEDCHQKTASSVFKHLEEFELELEKTQEEIWQEIDEIVVKTLICCQAKLSHQYNCTTSDDLDNSKCFSILSFDFVINKFAKPILLSVDACPSYLSEQLVESTIKSELL